MATTILGISPGTRILGIAIMRNRELIDFRVKCFKEQWSKIKQRNILNYIDNVVKYYGITAVAIKSPNPIRSSRQSKCSSLAITKMLEKKNVAVYSYTNLPPNVCVGIKCSNKNRLIESIAENYPELRRIYLKEINNHHPYYEKMFEAIAIVRWRAHKNEL